MKTRHGLAAALAAATLVFASQRAFAHTGHGVGGFESGFGHPFLGWDHVIAMVAVGLWSALLGRRALLALPVVFPLVMAFGGALGMLGVALPGVEGGIAASGLVLGLMVAFAVRPPLAVSMVLVGIFAIFHGHAHGAELPTSADAVAYALGFVIGTGLLHLAGIAIGRLIKAPAGALMVRGLGGLIALGGAFFLFGYA